LPSRGNCVNRNGELFAIGDEFQETAMAAHGEVEYGTATGNDYPAHESTYRLFITLVKWHIYVIGFILILMAYFLT
jgi:hypothetical protein